MPSLSLMRAYLYGVCWTTGVWVKMVTWPPASCIRWKWQQAVCLELDQQWASADIHRPPSSSKSYCMVPPPAWFAGIWWGHCRPMCTVLEHTHWSTFAVCGHWVAGVQPRMVQTLQWTGEYCIFLEECVTSASLYPLSSVLTLSRTKK